MKRPRKEVHGKDQTCRGLPRPTRKPGALEDSFHVLIRCRDEAEQREMFEKLTREGRDCRLLTV